MKRLAVYGYVGRNATNAMRERFVDFTDLVGRKSGIDLTVFEATSYEDLEDAVVSGYVDVAWLPPIPFVSLERRSAVVPLAAHVRGGRTHFHAALLVRRDAPIEDVSGLAGLRAAWVDRQSASGYVMPRVFLAERGVDPVSRFSQERFYGSHEAVVRAVAAGRADVGAAYEGAWLDVEGAAEEVRLLVRCGEIPGDATAARAALPEDLRSPLTAAIFAVSRERKHRSLLRQVFGIDELRPWEPSGYDTLRGIVVDASRRGLLVGRYASLKERT
jgi:phosphate/phosphite/phosphonate ABC transporter binding protein